MREIIAMEGAALEIGETVMVECPFCLAAERKFAITAYADGLGYICFRAGCGAKGSVNGMRELACQYAPKPGPKRFEPEEYVGELSPPQCDDFAGRCLARIGLSCETGERCYGVKSIRGGTGIYYPLWDYKGRQCGYQTRTEDKRVFTGRLLESQPYGMYSGGLGNMWVVEDPLSAIRLADHQPEGWGMPNALSILGTNLPDGLDFLRNYARVYVALDPGAEEAARKIVRSLRTVGVDAVMVILPDDIHRLDAGTFETLMETYS